MVGFVYDVVYVVRALQPTRAKHKARDCVTRMRALLQALLVLLFAQAAEAVHEARYAAIMSTRGIQYKDPWISDDFVVGCIMIMFLLLFCFGKQ